MVCQAHPTYVGKGKPTSTCRVCWLIYTEAHKSDKQFCEKHPVELKDGKCPVCQGGKNGTLSIMQNTVSAQRSGQSLHEVSVRRLRNRSNSAKRNR
jgi:rubredoxin